MAEPRVHLLRSGEWEWCNAAHCSFLFHVDEVSPQEAQALPLGLMLPIFEAVQPPSGYNEARRAKYWEDGSGELHRDYDLPAGVHEDGTLEWYQHGVHHRENGQPTWVGGDGHIEWHLNDELHRDGDMPAVIYSDGSRAWYQHGRLHRVGAPAEIESDGTERYFLNGDEVSREQACA